LTLKNFLITLFNHERYQTTTTLLAVSAIIWFIGCPARTKSLIDPTKQIGRQELQLEIEQLLQKAELGFGNIERQEKIRELLFQQSLIAVGTGTFNPSAFMLTIGSILGLGATIDNVRKRKEIKKLTPPPKPADDS